MELMDVYLPHARPGSEVYPKGLRPSRLMPRPQRLWVLGETSAKSEISGVTRKRNRS